MAENKMQLGLISTLDPEQVKKELTGRGAAIGVSSGKLAGNSRGLLGRDRHIMITGLDQTMPGLNFFIPLTHTLLKAEPDSFIFDPKKMHFLQGTMLNGDSGHPLLVKKGEYQIIAVGSQHGTAVNGVLNAWAPLHPNLAWLKSIFEELGLLEYQSELAKL